MKPFRTNITPFALGGVLALGISACAESGDEPVSERVATLDALTTLGPTPEELPFTDSPVIYEGTMHLCTTGESYEMRAVRERQDGGDACEAFPMEWFSKEGSYPWVDMMIDGTEYPANEVHLVQRDRDWFLFLEGAHDRNMMPDHYGNVFRIDGGDEIKLVPKCSGHIQGWEEARDGPNPYFCVLDILPSLDLALVKWAEDDSCVIDYSFCP